MWPVRSGAAPLGNALVEAPLITATAALGLLAVQFTFGLGDGALASFDARWTYNAVPILAAAACFVRARTRPERGAWLCVGAGILAWTAGDVYYTFVLSPADEVTFPSPADAGYLAVYPLLYVGLGLLVRHRGTRFARSVWLDGLIAALTVAGVATSIVFTVVVRATGGSTAAVATNLAYPLADALLLALVVAVVSLGGWTIDRAWLTIAGGLAVFAVADSVYLYRVATDSYHFGTMLDLGWLAAFVLLGAAATMPAAPLRARALEGRRLLIVPATFASISLVLEVVDHFLRVSTVAIVLVSLALAAVIVRMALTFNEYLHVLAAARRESVTDPLTHLGNRRALFRDLERALDRGAGDHLLLLFDLDGFKAYNDRFGHPAGDALLARLGGRFAQAVAPSGTAYRLGGDEFCAVVAGRPEEGDWALRQAARALSEDGDGFHVNASGGAVALPGEAGTASDALRLADRRMYQEKTARRSVSGEGRSVLRDVLRARDPRLAAHTSLVADVALATGRCLGLDDAELTTLEVVAELHDVGKVAIPDAILGKPGPLSDDEWELVRRHTIVGERIVNSVRGLETVAAAVRATHERWDGSGYPDGLAGFSIPLVARIVAVADAYEAMTSRDRAYRPVRDHEDAVAELIACAGSQFDPAVVAAFVAAARDGVGENFEAVAARA
jgi:diguanylate cyclase (GGDEF)-like protein